jgi:hypothetical protein
MGSFKLEKGGSAKEQARGAGAFLAIIGIFVMLLVMPVLGMVMVVLGLIFFLASFAASE